MTRIVCSRHATVSAQQRGIRPAVIEFVLQHADIDLEAGDGCRAYRISDKATVELLKNGIAISELDRARNIVLIVCEDSG